MEYKYAMLSLFAIFIICIILLIISYVLTSIAYSKSFEKMGEDKIAGWIPIYRDYIMYKNVFNTQMFVLYICLMIASVLFASFDISILANMLQIAYGIIQIIMLYYYAKSFGCDNVLTVVIILLGCIGMLIVAFDNKYLYMGNLSKKINKLDLDK